MRLPELCLALLCAAAAAGTGSPGAAREQSPGPAAAAGRASEAGRGAPGPAAPGTGGVDPRQTWMLLAGSPGRASGSRDRGRTGMVRDGTGAGRASVPASGQSPGKSPQAALQVGVPGAAAAPAGAPAVLEPLLRELQLLLKAIWRPCPGWRVVVTFSPSPSPESFTCRLGSMPLFLWTTLQALPSPFKVAPISAPFCWGCEKVLGTTQGAEPVARSSRTLLCASNCHASPAQHQAQGRPSAAAGAAGWSDTACTTEPSEAGQKMGEERIINNK
ncbi:erythroferrone isoform X3 [Aptenodytes patagonicus]|uniref:erythroferrone isoform X3 n=1 Tax=Aptenodytes patagonicus TaxID=9234 RepID=UPI003FA128BE